ncbi:MAG: SIMPL domain-containing protein [Labilithrix sp.]|nr:SIMPL domain-containing protein [Labilithrix sp.]MBX3220973.1 SIMPL domain-containing protein [Labilithrix sp.]
MLRSRVSRLAPQFLVALLIATGSLATGCGSPAPAASAAEADAHTNVVIVLGKGEVSRKPDIARATMGIAVAAPTVAEASRLANQQMTNLIAALKKEGIADKDVQTANFSINFERFEPPPIVMAPAPSAPSKPGAGPVPPAAPPPPPARAGQYRVSNTVRVTVRDLDKAGRLLDAAVAAGANEVWGISFEIDKPEALEAEAREKAAKDARVRAEAIAKTQGRTLGDVVSVSENLGGGARPMPQMMKSAEMASFDTPVAPGEIAVSAQLEVVYRLAAPTAK